MELEMYWGLFCGLGVLFLAKAAWANPACVVCTVAIGASLELARALGISDEVVGLWAGALFALLGYWLILWFERKGWRFAGRDWLLMALSLASIGFMYMGELEYSPQIIGCFYIDSFLLAALAGAALYVVSQKLYAYMKAANGGRAHFPFEKVVLPLVMLAGASWWVNLYTF